MRRDLFKTISFAVLHFAVGFGVSYAFTGPVVIAGNIALAETLANTVVFYIHERAWNRYERCGPAGRSGVTGSPGGRREHCLPYPPKDAVTIPVTAYSRVGLQSLGSHQQL